MVGYEEDGRAVCYGGELPSRGGHEVAGTGDSSIKEETGSSSPSSFFNGAMSRSRRSQSRVSIGDGY